QPRRPPAARGPPSGEPPNPDDSYRPPPHRKKPAPARCLPPAAPPSDRPRRPSPPDRAPGRPQSAAHCRSSPPSAERRSPCPASIPPSSVTGQTLRWATDKPAHQPSKSRKPATRRAFHLTDVEDFRAAFIIVEVVVIHLVGGLDARTAQRALIVELLQTGTRLILDLLVELGERLGIGRLFGNPLGTLIEVAHDRLTQRLGTLALQRRD